MTRILSITHSTLFFIFVKKEKNFAIFFVNHTPTKLCLVYNIYLLGWNASHATCNMRTKSFHHACAAINDDMVELESQDQKSRAKGRRKPKFVGPLKGPN